MVDNTFPALSTCVYLPLFERYRYAEDFELNRQSHQVTYLLAEVTIPPGIEGDQRCCWWRKQVAMHLRNTKNNSAKHWKSCVRFILSVHIEGFRRKLTTGLKI